MGTNTPRLFVVSLSILIVTALVGCGKSRPMATSMGDMRAERRVSGDRLFNYQEIITLDGSNPATHVGQTVYFGQPHIGYPSQLIRGVGKLVFPLWSQRDLNPSTAAFPIVYRSEQFDPELLNLQQAVRAKADTEAKKQVKREGAKTLKARHLQAVQCGKSGLKNDTYIERREYKSPGRSVVAKVAAKIETIQRHELIKIGLELELIKAESIEDNDEAVKALRTLIKTATAKITEERGKLQDLLTTDVAGTTKSGILIIRWATDEEQGLSLDAGEIFNGGLKTSKSRSGYLVLGGVRFSSLVLGQDFIRTVGYQLHAEEIPRLAKMIEQRMVGITKYMISAKHVAYVSDLQTQLNAQFSANISKDMLKKLSSIDQIKLQYALSTIGNFNNMGQLGDPEVEKLPYVFGGPDTDKREGDWMPIYSVIAMPKSTLFRSIEKNFGEEAKLASKSLPPFKPCNNTPEQLPAK